MSKSTAYSLQVMLDVFQFRTYSLPVSCLNTQNLNFACYFVWVRKLVSDINGRTQIEAATPER
jgi:hypothetical protein